MSERERQWERTFHGPLTRALEAISTATPGRISIHGVVAESLAVDPDWWASMQEVCAEAAARLRELEQVKEAGRAHMQEAMDEHARANRAEAEIERQKEALMDELSEVELKLLALNSNDPLVVRAVEAARNAERLAAELEREKERIRLADFPTDDTDSTDFFRSAREVARWMRTHGAVTLTAVERIIAMMGEEEDAVQATGEGELVHPSDDSRRTTIREEVDGDEERTAGDSDGGDG